MLNMILTIDGTAGAGKTTLAEYMCEQYKDQMSVAVVHMDDLYDGWDDALGPKLTLKLEGIVSAHKSGEEFRTTAFDWKRNEPGSELVIPPVDLLILEGVGAGQSAIRDAVETKIWIDLEPIVGLRRVLARDGHNIEEQMLAFLELERIHFLKEGTRDAAEFHLNGLN
jgi:uridine kinase